MVNIDRTRLARRRRRRRDFVSGFASGNLGTVLLGPNGVLKGRGRPAGQREGVPIPRGVG